MLTLWLGLLGLLLSVHILQTFLQTFKRFNESLKRLNADYRWKKASEGKIPWSAYIEGYPDHFRERIRKGIPWVLRPNIWRCLLGVDKIREEPSPYFQPSSAGPMNEYDSKLDLYKNSQMEIILKYDVNPNKLDIETLSFVLHSYVDFKARSGFTFVSTEAVMNMAMVLLLIMDSAVDAFWGLIAITFEDRVRKPFTYLIDMPDVYILEERFGIMISFYLPDLPLRHDQVYCYWLRTAFVDFPLHVVARVWENFMIEGEDFLLKFGIALLLTQETALNNVTAVDDLSALLSSYHSYFYSSLVDEEEVEKLLELTNVILVADPNLKHEGWRI